MATIIFTHQGKQLNTELKPGQRLLAAGYKVGLEDCGFGDCGGNLVCGTCHVRVQGGAFPPPKPDELDVLAVFPKVYPNSRLACQLAITPAHTQVEVEWVG